MAMTVTESVRRWWGFKGLDSHIDLNIRPLVISTIPAEIRHSLIARVRAGSISQPDTIKEVADYLRENCGVLIVWDEAKQECV